MKSGLFALLLFALTATGVYSQSAPVYGVEQNGLLKNNSVLGDREFSSANGIYRFTYNTGAVTDEIRVLTGFRLYKNNALQFTMDRVPGSDISVSDNGYTVVYDHSFHFDQKVTLMIYSPAGAFLFSKTYRGASGFTFSDKGNYLMVRNTDNTDLIDLSNRMTLPFPKGLVSCYNEALKQFVVADEEMLSMFVNGKYVFAVKHNLALPRRTDISGSGGAIAVISGDALNIYNTKGELTGSSPAEYGSKYRDIKYDGEILYAGIHTKTKTSSSGSIKLFDKSARLLNIINGPAMRNNPVNKISVPAKSSAGYEAVPWPFAPFDSARTVWNHYEQHMGLYDTSSYLHQGLDLIIPIAEPAYAVKAGIVKCVLTIGGASYWRLAISDSQNSGVSDGWLYAHLIQNTIQVDIGDTVQQFDHLADIIAWTSDWAHIHFANIKDSGAVWLYSDNEWGINFNPLFAVTPLNDTQPPYILPVFPGTMFAFTKNETNTYLDPQALRGEIDIIAHTVDTICNSGWQQPANRVYYEIKNGVTGAVVKPKTLGHILNHPYTFYESGNYIPYAGVIYKRDAQLLPSGWMSMNRDYFHNLTNSNGDSLITLEERELGLNTQLYPNGIYNIIVTAFDPSGNKAVDSMTVTFNNPGMGTDTGQDPEGIYLTQNYPNPFSDKTIITYNVAGNNGRGDVSVLLQIFDVLGNLVATPVRSYQTPGKYQVEFEAATNRLPGGLYLYRLACGGKSVTRKMMILK